jgi:predicted TIM-barrel fold metal-dependent hydrolase
VSEAEAQAARGQRICDGIVGFADLELGDRLETVLDRHLDAAKGRFRGIRARAAWDADPEAGYGPAGTPEGVMLRPGFRDGVNRLCSRDLSLDVWAFHPQLGEIASLADACPDARIVVNHVGGPLGVGRYRGQQREVFGVWSAAITELARRENVYVKLGGFGVSRMGFEFSKAPKPPSSDELARSWKPYVDVCVSSFGAARCMFGSNFPPDKVNCDFGVLLNAFKKMISGGSPDERSQIFAGTANKFYRLKLGA